MNARTAVYRLYDANSRLLYVGISNEVEERWKRHAKDKPWWPDVARKATDWYRTRVEALAVEKSAIRYERPRYNLDSAGHPAAVQVTGAPIRPTVDAADESAWFTSEDVAKRYHTSAQAVGLWRHTGYGPRFAKIGRRILYPLSALEEFDAKLLAPTEPRPATAEEAVV